MTDSWTVAPAKKSCETIQTRSCPILSPNRYQQVRLLQPISPKTLVESNMARNMPFSLMIVLLKPHLVQEFPKHFVNTEGY